MKNLRILTGLHAGAQVKLSAKRYRIGPDDDADIHVADCGDAHVILSIDERGTVTLVDEVSPHAMTVEAGADEQHVAGSVTLSRDSDPETGNGHIEEQTPVLLPDFVPFQLGKVAICIGNEDDIWPPDIELLDALFSKQKGHAMIGRSSRKIMVYLLGSALVVLLAASIVLLLSSGDGEAAQARSQRAIADRTAAALSTAGFQELHVSVRGHIVVTGMVRTAGDDTAARTILKRIAGRGTIIERRYDIASNIVRTLTENEDMRGAKVDYVGDGVFRVTGMVDHLEKAKEALTKLGPDFDSNVHRIDNQLTQSPNAGPATPYSEVISNQKIQFLQTPDGMKHLYVVK